MKTSISHQQSLSQNFIHVASTMDDAKDENAGFYYLVEFIFMQRALEHKNSIGI